MRVIVANCRFEGTQILLPFLLENLVPNGDPNHIGYIWEGQIDTGFSGFLMMPFKSVQQNGLELMASFGTWTLADGTTISSIDTAGNVSLVGRKSFAVVNSPTNSPDCGILIGQKMLEAWNVKLEVDPVNKIAQLIALPPK